MTPDLFERTVAREGVRLKAYRDSRGIWTIGIGHNIEADPAMMARLHELQTIGITMDEAKALFHRDAANFCAGLDKHLPWWRQLDDVRQDVIFDMAFNMGLGELETWHHTLADVEAHNYPLAAYDMLQSAWAKQTGRRANADDQEMRTGVECSL